MGRIVARVTFSPKATPAHGFSHEHVENVVASAIGLYHLRVTGAIVYKGKQPRRTSTTRTTVPEPPLVAVSG